VAEQFKGVAVILRIKLKFEKTIHSWFHDFLKSKTGIRYMKQIEVRRNEMELIPYVN